MREPLLAHRSTRNAVDQEYLRSAILLGFGIIGPRLRFCSRKHRSHEQKSAAATKLKIVGSSSRLLIGSLRWHNSRELDNWSRESAVEREHSRSKNHGSEVLADGDVERGLGFRARNRFARV